MGTGAEVREADAQARAAVDERGRQVDAAVPRSRADASRRLRASSPRWRKHTVDSCGSCSSSKRGCSRRLRGQVVRERERARDPGAERRRAVDAEGQPQLAASAPGASTPASRRRGWRRPPRGACSCSWCANALLSAPARLQHHEAAALLDAHPLVRVDASPSRRGRGRRSAARGGARRRPGPRRRRPRGATRRARAHTSAIASSGSTAPVSVVPAVATTAIGVTPAATSAASASARASGRIRRRSSSSMRRTASLPSPATSTARTTE